MCRQEGNRGPEQAGTGNAGSFVNYQRYKEGMTEKEEMGRRLKNDSANGEWRVQTCRRRMHRPVVLTRAGECQVDAPLSTEIGAVKSKGAERIAEDCPFVSSRKGGIFEEAWRGDRNI